MLQIIKPACRSPERYAPSLRVYMHGFDATQKNTIPHCIDCLIGVAQHTAQHDFCMSYSLPAKEERGWRAIVTD